MSIAFVLGNGLSRQNVIFDDLKKHGPIYGCNALYRDYTPDVLVSTDKPIAEHIEKLGYPLTNKFYTRKPSLGSGAFPIPEPYYGFSSGPVAVALAALERYRKIYMIGFDMGPTTENRFNNLYANTEFYKTSEAFPTYTGNWIRQIQSIAKEFPESKFIRVVGATTATITELQGIKNLLHLPLEQLNAQLNNGKDF